MADPEKDAVRPHQNRVICAAHRTEGDTRVTSPTCARKSLQASGHCRANGRYGCGPGDPRTPAPSLRRVLDRFFGLALLELVPRIGSRLGGRQPLGLDLREQLLLALPDVFAERLDIETRFTRHGKQALGACLLFLEVMLDQL